MSWLTSFVRYGFHSLTPPSFIHGIWTCYFLLISIFKLWIFYSTSSDQTLFSPVKNPCIFQDTLSFLKKQYQCIWRLSLDSTSQLTHRILCLAHMIVFAGPPTFYLSWCLQESMFWITTAPSRISGMALLINIWLLLN